MRAKGTVGAVNEKSTVTSAVADVTVDEDAWPTVVDLGGACSPAWTQAV